MKTRIVNRRNTREFDVFIGRPSKWGNPYRIQGATTREVAIAEFEGHLQVMIHEGEITMKELADLHGKTLACWCAPEPCHGDLLAQYAESAYNTDLANS